MAMHGLDLTFATLATTRNEAAIDVLALAVEDRDPATRRRALEALIARREARSAEVILERWNLLRPDDIGALIPGKRKMAAAIERVLRTEQDDVSTAIAATVQLALNELIPALVRLAESSECSQLRRQACDAVLELVVPLSRDARRNDDRPSERGPALARLAKSVQRFAVHQNTDLLDAFLAVATWSDRDLRQLLDPASRHAAGLIHRFVNSRDPAVIELATGFLRHRTLPEPIAPVITGRTDSAFRDRLLRTIGVKPSTTVLRNLRTLGIPRCCRGGESLLNDLPVDQHAALAHLYVAADTDNIRTLHLLAAVVQRGGHGAEAAAARGFTRCEVPDFDVWAEAAIPIAAGDDPAIQRDPHVRLLYRLIHLLSHANPNVVQAVRHVLAPLHTVAMLPRFDSLDRRTRRRLGEIVRWIDPDAIDCVAKALRHPILERRLQAITAADALAAVDELAESFAHVVRQDHQNARVRAVEALRHASGARTLELLNEMIDRPQSTVRDAAAEALQNRLPKSDPQLRVG